MLSFVDQRILFIISSPSGAGKTTLTKALCEDDPDLKLSVSVTTRAPRFGEVHGKDYLFVSHQEFTNHLENQAFAEHAFIFGNHYGTLHSSINDLMFQGKDILFDVDWQGMQLLKRSYPKKFVTLFILPPSLAALRERLEKRGKDTDDVINNRLLHAYKEISYSLAYDYVLMNDDFHNTLEDIKNIIKAERLKHHFPLKSVMDRLLLEHHGML